MFNTPSFTVVVGGEKFQSPYQLRKGAELPMALQGSNPLTPTTPSTETLKLRFPAATYPSSEYHKPTL